MPILYGSKIIIIIILLFKQIYLYEIHTYNIYIYLYYKLVNITSK